MYRKILLPIYKLEWGNQNNNYIVEITSTLKLKYEDMEKLRLESTFVGVFSVIENFFLSIKILSYNNSAILKF